jgi:pilus assembly protein Flp/PilA
MSRIKASMAAFAADDEGATAIEYALMASMVAIGVIAALRNYQTAMTGMYEEIRQAMLGVVG